MGIGVISGLALPLVCLAKCYIEAWLANLEEDLANSFNWNHNRNASVSQRFWLEFLNLAKTFQNRELTPNLISDAIFKSWHGWGQEGGCGGWGWLFMWQHKHACTCTAVPQQNSPILSHNFFLNSSSSDGLLAFSCYWISEGRLYMYADCSHRCLSGIYM
jgi:hypothetical protein